MKPVTSIDTIVLRFLGPETFGDQVRRAREASGLTLVQTAEAVSEFLPVSQMSVKRLEEMAHPPADRKRRMLAYLTLVAYGFDPAGFNLDESDLPRGMSAESVMHHMAKSRARWITEYACNTAECNTAPTIRSFNCRTRRADKRGWTVGRHGIRPATVARPRTGASECTAATPRN